MTTPAIESLRAERKAKEAQAAEVARQIWTTLDAGERGLVKLAMFPADKMRPVEGMEAEDSHRVTVALMDLACGGSEA